MRVLYRDVHRHLFRDIGVRHKSGVCAIWYLDSYRSKSDSLSCVVLACCEYGNFDDKNGTQTHQAQSNSPPEYRRDGPDQRCQDVR